MSYRWTCLPEDQSCRRTSCGRSCIMGGHVLQEDMSCSKTYHEGRSVLHDDMSCKHLFKCNHTFFSKCKLKSFGFSLRSAICVEAATNYVAVSSNNCCGFFSLAPFRLLLNMLSKKLSFAMFLLCF